MGRTAVGARSAPISADDRVKPPGLPRMILSGAMLAVTSSELGRTATPWIDSSSDISTKSCRLMKPRSRQRHGDVGERGIGNVAYRRQRLRWRQHRIGECDRPACPRGLILARERRHLRTAEANADRLALF